MYENWEFIVYKLTTFFALTLFSFRVRLWNIWGGWFTCAESIVTTCYVQCIHAFCKTIKKTNKWWFSTYIVFCECFFGFCFAHHSNYNEIQIVAYRWYFVNVSVRRLRAHYVCVSCFMNDIYVFMHASSYVQCVHHYLCTGHTQNKFYT